MGALKEMGPTQILIADPMSVYYLTGVYVEPPERFYALYPRENGNHVYFLDKLFTVSEDVGVGRIWHSDTDPAAEIVTGYLNKENPLGIDKDLKTRFLLPLMEMGIVAGFVNSSIAVDRTRGVKDEEEQDKMYTASDINDRAMMEFKKLIHEGVTEWQVADQMLKIYMDLGAYGFSLEPLAAFGANATGPHHGPDGTVVKPGDPVLFDVDCVRDGYCSDMTRTFYFQEASDGHRRIYEIVHSTNETVISKIRPGVPLCKLDGTARDLIAEQGYRPFFTHRLRCFIGLGEHEFGNVPSVNTRRARPGMIFSIKSRIYLSGGTSVRVEDLVLVIEEGYEVLNHYSKKFEIIG